MKIIAAGLPLRLKARLVGRLKEFDVKTVATGKELLEHLASDRYDLLIVDEQLKDPDAVETIQGCQRFHRGPIIFCASQGHTAEFLELLVNRLRVSAIMQHPVDPDELVRSASATLSMKMPELEPEGLLHSGVPAALIPVWRRHEATNRARVTTLVEFGQNGLESLTEEKREEARRAAHQLAGSLGTFGMGQASLLAKEAEDLIVRVPELSGEQQMRLAHVIRALELQMVDPSAQLPEPETEELPKGTFLIYSADSQMTDRIQAAASKAGWRALATADAGGARKLLSREQPTAVLLDFSDSLLQESLSLFQEFSGKSSARLVAIVPSVGWLPLKNCPMLVKPVLPQQVIEALERDDDALKDTPRVRVLAVDDDPLVLETVSVLLQSLHVEVHVQQNALRFWDTLERVSPELLILDVDLPFLGGIELCRAVRSDPKYCRIPILFLSAYNDGDTVNRVFQAGGDDYIYKPVVGPELLTRVSNRLERSRAFGSISPSELRPQRSRTDVAIDIRDDELVRLLTARGLRVADLTEELALDSNPRILLVDNLDLVCQLDGLGVTERSQVWVLADLSADEILEAFELGATAFYPKSLSREKLVRKLERALTSV